MLEEKFARKAELKEKELELRRMELELQKRKMDSEEEERKKRVELELEERRAMLELLKNIFKYCQNVMKHVWLGLYIYINDTIFISR